MCVRCLGFVLLVWFPGVLRAQSAAQACRPPSLNGGYVVPEKDTYPDGTTLTYGCDTGHKPAVESWWATVTCQNGRWSPEPECIKEKACLPPAVSNANYSDNPNGWYEEGSTTKITCNKGYDHRGQKGTATCINGTWPSVPVCEKSVDACSEPPKIPHAVIVHQEYQEVFAADSELQYKCEDGFTAERHDVKKSLVCRNGKWTAGPACNRKIVAGGGNVGFCTLHSADYPALKPFGVKYILEGEEVELECVKPPGWFKETLSQVQCVNGKLLGAKC